MCGIIGAIAERNVVPILLEGLRRMEYRGYDSAGIAVINKQKIERVRVKGKVAELTTALAKEDPLKGFCGIAHTRWATHGKPSTKNAHPHMSGQDLVIVHNGIIENHKKLHHKLSNLGYKFDSETDTETIAHLIDYYLQQNNNLLHAVQLTVRELEGAFALGIIHSSEPEHLIAVRSGSPLVIGLGIGENFIASDQLALLPVTNRFIYLEEGDIADISCHDYVIFNQDGKKVKRTIHTSSTTHDAVERGQYKHYMQKEIFEQPTAIQHTLEQVFSNEALAIFKTIKRIQIVACGTSYHAGLVARYWLEELAGIATQVEIASEIRYRKNIVEPDTLFITISQSGETADTLAALRKAKESGYKSTLAICNVAESSLARESDLCFLTKAGPEIGVASTKAFTTQLVALLKLTIALSNSKEINVAQQLQQIPVLIQEALALDPAIKKLAASFAEKQHTFFLGRGSQYPIAMEGALKLKEISYIHAESYPAGELKHGPLALIDKEMPVIVVAPNNELLEKLISNIHEVRARGGKLIVFADGLRNIHIADDVFIIKMPAVAKEIAPIIYTIPLQLLAYHVAVLKGTDVDQPRNLAKSVTVE